MITQIELKKLLDYNQDTGIFTWKVSRGKAKINGVAGTKRKDKYIQIAINKKHYLLHRLAWLYVNNNFPEFIDHINGDKSDNRICNLRKVNSSQNMHNSKLNIKNKSGIKGISWNKNRNKWEARVCINYKNKFIGYFDDIKLAELLINKARIELHGNFARNF
jgi:hypothetical protein